MSLATLKKIVISGGPGVGKTTTIQELQKINYATIPEAFSVLYQEAQEKENLDIFCTDRTQLHHQVFEKQCALEKLHEDKTVILCDRSAVDIIGFTSYYKNHMSDHFFDAIAQHRYNLVFFLDPLPIHLYQNSDIRRESWHTSLIIHDHIKKGYEQLNYELINVPFGTIQDRLDFILNHLHV